MLNSMVESLGEILKRERKKKHLSQRQLGLKSGVSRSYINIIESGYHQGKITTEVVSALAKALDIPVQELMGVADMEFRIGEMVAKSVKDALPGMVKEAMDRYQAELKKDQEA